MKKEFKAPTIETKLLSTMDSVMDENLTILSGSDEANKTLSEWSDNDVSGGFKQWKGNN